MHPITPEYSPGPRTTVLKAPESPSVVVLLAVAKTDVARYPCGAGTATAAHTTSEAMQALERLHPRVVVIDWDLTTIDAPAVCRAASQRPSATVMITTEFPDRVPAALKCGCHAVLLKPFSINLAAARLGRLLRDASIRLSPNFRRVVEQGTNRTWLDTSCPGCAAAGAVSFDFASHRQSWYACPSCDHVWRGARQE